MRSTYSSGGLAGLAGVSLGTAGGLLSGGGSLLDTGLGARLSGGLLGGSSLLGGGSLGGSLLLIRCEISADEHQLGTNLTLVVVLGLAAALAAGLGAGSFLASFRGPEGPEMICQSHVRSLEATAIWQVI